MRCTQIVPASGPDDRRYADGGPNFARPWMGGLAAYSTNWSRWMRVDHDMGNEGVGSPLTFVEHYPSHDLSREIFHPGGHRTWMGPWGDDAFFPRLMAGRTCQLTPRLKAAGIRGPADAPRRMALPSRCTRFQNPPSTPT